jgi:phage terminase large subunit-like protein
MPYDEALAQKAIEWFPRYLTHTKGQWAGVPFELLPWQKEVVGRLFGTVKEDGTRQYRHVYVEIPKKNGKSELGAGIALKLLFADSERYAEIYSAAADRDQAAIVFNVSADMVRASPQLSKRCKVIESTKRIVHNNGGFYRVLSAEAHTKHGFNVHGVIFDELHAQPDRRLWDVLTQGSGDARTQPVFFTITTAGYDRHSICWEQHAYALKVRDTPDLDPTFLPILYSADEEDDWTSESVWKKCNPSLGEIISVERVREACKKAQEVPALENSFRQLRLNQWVKQEVRFLPMKHWRACPFAEDLDISGEVVYGALDLASTTDIAAFVLLHPAEDDFFDVIPFFWIPEESMRERSIRDGVPYERWVSQGLMYATPGNVIDYRSIHAKIMELSEKYQIAEIAYDPWNATHFIQGLIEEGATMITFRQGFISMTAPTKELLKLVLSHKIRHNGHEVLDWMADNVVVSKDPAGNLKPDKAKSTEKIDGIVALIMALDRAVRHEADPAESVYESRGIDFL